MNKFMIALNLSIQSSKDGREITERRMRQIFQYLFTLGPAWSPTRGVVFLETACSMSNISSTLTDMLLYEDFMFLVKIENGADAQFGGRIADEDGLLALFKDSNRIEMLPKM